ncbi:exodeoxyribonuclease V subunit alpha [Vibrio hibernica]|uniref:exodeoxyribonuclease V subunit alpha n=1 Tax=Vibrio hibernica TaxID=2587465 RepID=UPI001E61B1E3|nr:exodeoxyribonuclease V subunit alpha [Vibrio hibernica]
MNTLVQGHCKNSSNRALTFMKLLQQHGVFRAIDVQLATWVHQQSLLADQQAVNTGQTFLLSDQQQLNADSMALLTCMVSYEFGRGHICLNLDEWDLVQSLSLRFLFKRQPELQQQYGEWIESLVHIDWQSLCLASSLVESAPSLTTLGQISPKPLVLENRRIYLHRYWQYETQVADQLRQRAEPLALSTRDVENIAQTLNRLFERDYSYLWQAISPRESSQVQRQQWVCEMLDVQVESDALKKTNASQVLDWSAIDSVLTQATSVSDLQILDTLVPTSVCLNWQKVAAAVALSRRFAVISGGPGTGKTTTVVKLLAALIEQSLGESNSSAACVPTIKLVAPTGKAAARLTESIGSAIEQLPIAPNIKALLPSQSSTIHRLLGARPNTVAYQYNRNNPLHVDILVVDEASMIDLPMMFRLLEALPKQARLILLGDKDQLSSVEAGAILGDICQFSSIGYQANYLQILSKLTGFEALPVAAQGSAIADSLCMLQKSYRFHARSGIGQLAKAINAGDAQKMQLTWQQGFDDIALYPFYREQDLSIDSTLATAVADNERLTQKQIQPHLLSLLVKGYQTYCAGLSLPIMDDRQSEVALKASMEKKISMEQKALHVLNAFSKTRLLCAVREGEYGVVGMNREIEKALAQQRLIQPVENEKWYVGKPIMISQNDSALGLHNGDIGMCLLDESETNPRLRVYFEMPDGRIKGILPSRIPTHELAFAMTIHKSQGSEFDHTILLLPVKLNPILTKELIYTGVTRAKSRLDLFANPQVLAKGILIKTKRTSGLSEKLTNYK